MAQVKDPVCGMMVDSDTAPGRSIYEGTTYYFCSTQCAEQFERNPTQYVGDVGARTAGATGTQAAPLADRAENPERHEPPYTKTDSILAPKFGSAGSGGAEYEPLPEAHDRHDTGGHGTR